MLVHCKIKRTVQAYRRHVSKQSRHTSIWKTAGRKNSADQGGVEAAEKDLTTMFFSLRRYDLGRVGRYKLNKKFEYDPPIEDNTLVALTIMIAESKPEEKELMVNLVMQFLTN